MAWEACCRSMCPRSYDASKRRVAAEGTRTRILEATRTLIGGKGDLTDFSMETVAQRAGVSRMTVYYQFESRAGLLDALADHLAARGGMERMRAVFLEPDRDRALRRLVETFVGFWAHDRETMRRLRAMALVFPSMARGPRDRDAWRREAVSRLLERHAERGRAGRAPLRNDLIDLLTALTGFDAFDALCTGGRKPEAVSVLLGDLAVELARRGGEPTRSAPGRPARA